jgi:hypothetical protein
MGHDRGRAGYGLKTAIAARGWVSGLCGFGLHRVAAARLASDRVKRAKRGSYDKHVASQAFNPLSVYSLAAEYQVYRMQALDAKWTKL